MLKHFKTTGNLPTKYSGVNNQVNLTSELQILKNSSGWRSLLIYQDVKM